MAAESVNRWWYLCDCTRARTRERLPRLATKVVPGINRFVFVGDSRRRKANRRVIPLTWVVRHRRVWAKHLFPMLLGTRLKSVRLQMVASHPRNLAQRWCFNITHSHDAPSTYMRHAFTWGNCVKCLCLIVEIFLFTEVKLAAKWNLANSTKYNNCEPWI